MNTVAVAFRYLWARPLATLLNLLLLTLGLASITFVLLASEQVSRGFQRDLAGIDTVVGAKGSPMQLILSGVFQLDSPPGNILYSDVQALQRMPEVNKLIPISMGDSLRGWRIVGTSQEYLAHYALSVAEGQSWTRPMEAVLGAHVARSTGLRSGDSFVANHGLGQSGSEHGQTPYRVSGVLAACACAADRLVLTSLLSGWHVHDSQRMEDAAIPAQDRLVNMALISYKNPQAASEFVRMVNTRTNLQAAAPAAEVRRLMGMLGVGMDVLKGLAGVLLVTAALSVFIALWNAVHERRADLAMLRMLGATPMRVAALLLCEALLLALMASVLGLAAGHLVTSLVGALMTARQSLPITGAIWLPQELWIVVSAIGVAFVAALIPALTAYRMDVAQLLNAR